MNTNEEKKPLPVPEESQLDLVDEVGDESFPASDPPAWSGLHAGNAKDAKKKAPEPEKP